MNLDVLPEVVDAPDAERRFGGLRRLYGSKAYERIRTSRIAIVGVGGVGSWVAEALARSGVAALTLIDFDQVSESNINRQVQALGSSVGMSKVLALRERIADIHPDCEVLCVDEFVDEANWPQLLSAPRPAEAGGPPRGPWNVAEPHFLQTRPVDAVVDACDQVRAKAVMASWSLRTGVPLVIVGAAGGKRRPQDVEVADLSQVTHDPLLASLRHRLRKQDVVSRTGAMGVQCVFSREAVMAPEASCAFDSSLNCHGYGSSVAVTATFGMVAASLALETLALE